MLRVAGEHASGTILWMADERAIGDHVVPRITKAAAEAGRPAPRVVAGVPVALCADDEVDAAREWANQALGHAEYSPNYQRLLEHGDATDVGDVLAAGDEAAVVERLRSFRDAGVTDLAVRVLPLGTNRDERIASRQRVLDVRGVAHAPSSEPAMTVTVVPARSPACGCSRSGTSSPGRSPGCCSPTSAPTSSRSSPIGGDLSRQVGSQFVGEHNVYFASLNRNKRSVYIDLTTDEGQAQLGALVRDRRRAAREPAAVDDPQARARLRVAAPVQPTHRARWRSPGTGSTARPPSGPHSTT